MSNEAKVTQSNPKPLSDNLSSRLNVIQETGKFAPEVIDRFGTFLENAPDQELFRMSPFRYAEQSNTATQEAIDLFLHATHVGILEFNWGVLCPSCGAFLTTKSGLRWLQSRKKCSICYLDNIESSIDDNIEVAFTVSPTVRKIRFHNLESLDFKEDGLFIFFSTNVALHPEVHQILHSSIFHGDQVQAQATIDIPITFEENHYFVMIPASHAAAHISVNETGTTTEVEFEILLDGQIVPDYVTLAPGAGTIRIHNRTRNTVMLGLMADPHLAPTPPTERSYPIQPLYTLTPYLTGKQLVTLQTFRDLFRTESIPSPGGLEFKNLSLLFTDLKSSTEMYERIGDFQAYALVREHFALLRGIIAAYGGSIVKTIGDAVMASFAEPRSALEAAAVMNREIKRTSGSEELLLKIGIHAGSCIAIEQNDRLDYFGQSVNIAARVQGVAQGGEIVCTEAIYNASGADEIIRNNRLNVEKDSAVLKGVYGVVPFYRLH